MIIVIVFSTVLAVAYALLLLLFWIKWNQISISKAESINFPKVSVVIPFRNEALSLPQLLNAIYNQDYPKEKFEVILINDRSMDEGKQIVEEFIKEKEIKSIRFFDLDKGQYGKKAALYAAVSKARHEVILQTDADVTMSSRWISTMVSSFEDNSVKAVLGPVEMRPTKGFWSRFAALEFLSLQATGAALTQQNMPVMSNGANMAYYKADWIKHHGEGQSLSSGDDTFFIQRMAIEGNSSVAFVKSREAIISTNATIGFKEFINQRVRWGGKTPAYPLKAAKWLAGFIGLLNLTIVFLFLAGILNKDFALLGFSLIIAKSFSDFLLLRSYASFFKSHKTLTVFIPSAIIYPWYIVITSIWILIAPKKTKWKGRPIRV